MMLTTTLVMLSSTLLAAETTANDIAGVIDQLDNAGITVVDRTSQLSPSSRVRLQQHMHKLGAMETSFVELPSGTRACAMIVTDEPARTMVAESFLESVRFDDVVVAPTSIDLAGWHDFAESAEQHGGVRDESFGLKAALTLTRLNMLRNQIQLFEVINAASPDFETAQWSQFEDAGFVLADTDNPLSSATQTDRVGVTHTPGADGTAVPENRVGWVWNAADKQLFPAGRSVESLREVVRLRDAVIVAAAQAGSDDMRSYVLDGNLSALRTAIELFRTRGVGEAPNGNPTLEQLNTPGLVIDGIPINVFNDQNTIQDLTWSGDESHIAGDAGWNYDENTGTIWANTVNGEQ